MVSSALSANRAVAVLDWIASHPGDAFTLSELSRALDVNIPSLMAVLQSLTEAGYLSRHPARKTYEMGPALLAVGLVVSTHQRSVEILSRELEALADAVGTECFASVMVGEQSVVVADAGRPGAHSLAVRVGLRTPLMAPIGHVFMAWSTPEEIEAWIERAEGEENQISRERIESELELTRRYGFCATHFYKLDFGPTTALERLAELPRDPRRKESVRAAVADFSARWEVLAPEPGQRYDVSNISAPVFNARGKVIMAIIINGFAQIDGDELLAHGDRLLRTARFLTKQSDGRVPE